MFEKFAGWEPVIVDVANPGAGANFDYTLLANFIYQPLGIQFTYTTSAVAGTRAIRIAFADAVPANFMYHCHIATWATTGVARSVNMRPGVLAVAAPVVSTFLSDLPFPLLLLGGWHIRSAMEGMDANDTITNIKLYLARQRYTPVI